jgi:prepilin signal peptidase PulO-like enzyme (type II secretory pathway)
MIELVLGFGLILFILALIDLKYKAIPSVFLTLILFVMLVIRFENLKYGLLAGVFAYLVYELTTYNKTQFGVADIKVMIMIGLLIGNLFNFLIFLGCFGVGQLVYVFINLKYSKNNNTELPFIPMFFALYITMAIGGVVS